MLPNNSSAKTVVQNVGPKMLAEKEFKKTITWKYRTEVLPKNLPQK